MSERKSKNFVTLLALYGIFNVDFQGLNHFTYNYGILFIYIYIYPSYKLNMHLLINILL